MDNGQDGSTTDTERLDQRRVLDIRHLTQSQLASLGVSQIAYVRRITVNGATAFSIHAADGTPMALAADFDVALAAVNQNEMVPALVH